MAVVWTCSSQSLHAADRGLVVFTWLYLAHVLIGDVEAPVRVSGAPLTTAWATRSSRTRCVTPSRKLGSKRRSKLAAHLFCPEAIQTNESVKRRTNARTVKWHEALRDCARMLQVGCWKHDARLENTALQLMLCDAEKRERLVPLERLVDRRGHRPSPRLMRFAASEWYNEYCIGHSSWWNALLLFALSQRQERELHAGQCVFHVGASHTWRQTNPEHLNWKCLFAIDVHHLKLSTQMHLVKLT